MDKKTRLERLRAKGESEPVDLGLSKIIKPIQDKIESLNLPDTQKVTPEISSSENIKDSTFASLASQGKWQELTLLCESKMASLNYDEASLEGIEARLWWVKTQLHLGRMPINILAAPLDSSSKALLDLQGYKGEMRDFGATLLLEMGDKLDSSGEEALAYAFKDRASKLCPGPNIQIKGEAKKVPLQNQIKESFDRIQKKEPEKRRFRYAILLTIFLGGIVWFSLEYKTIKTFFSAPLKRNLSFLAYPAKIESIPPKVERSGRVSELDALFYEMEQKNVKLKTDPMQEKDQEQIQSEENTNKERQAKETINTSSPIEKPPLPKIVKEDEQKAKENTDSSSFRVDTGAKEKREEVRLPIHPPPSKAFETFAQPRYYEILVTTKVMPMPSIRGLPLAELQPGDRILVEGKEGYWLRLRSTEKKTGYILSQDAVMEANW